MANAAGSVSVTPFRFLPSSLVNHFYHKYYRNSAQGTQPRVSSNYLNQAQTSSAKDLNEVNNKFTIHLKEYIEKHSCIFLSMCI